MSFLGDRFGGGGRVPMGLGDASAMDPTGAAPGLMSSINSMMNNQQLPAALMQTGQNMQPEPPAPPPPAQMPSMNPEMIQMLIQMMQQGGSAQPGVPPQIASMRRGGRR